MSTPTRPSNGATASSSSATASPSHSPSSSTSSAAAFAKARAERPQICGPHAPERPYPIYLHGTVQKGFGRGGKDLGCPTANLPASVLGPTSKITRTGIYFGFARVLPQDPDDPDLAAPGEEAEEPGLRDDQRPDSDDDSDEEEATEAEPEEPQSQSGAAAAEGTAEAHSAASGLAAATSSEAHPSSSSSPNPNKHPRDASGRSSRTGSLRKKKKARVELADEDSKVFPMVMSVGYNPFYGNQKKTAEAHVMHKFQRDFYGLEIRVVVLGYIRPEFNYVSREALIDDIETDKKVALNSLARDHYQDYASDPFLGPQR